MFTELLQNAFSNFYQHFVDLIPGFLAGLVVFLIFFGFSFIVRIGVKKVGDGKLNRRKELYGRISQTIILTVGIILALGITGIDIAGVIAGLGLLSVGLSFTLQDLLVNFLAGLQLLGQAPFEIGDYIDVNGVKGIVRKIGSRAVTVEAVDGKNISIPNRDMMTRTVLVQKLNNVEHLIFTFESAPKKNLTELREQIIDKLDALPGLEAKSCKVFYKNLGLRLEVEIQCHMKKTWPPRPPRRVLHSQAMQAVTEIITPEPSK